MNFWPLQSSNTITAPQKTTNNLFAMGKDGATLQPSQETNHSRGVSDLKLYGVPTKIQEERDLSLLRGALALGLQEYSSVIVFLINQ
jgi:hypothetical protein